MLKPVTNEETKVFLGAPPGWDVASLGPCNALPVAMETDSSGTPTVFYSYWRGTWGDRLAILLGRPVRLCVLGSAHPIVSLDTKRR